MADYYISTDDGRVHHITGVTATPTIVLNDGAGGDIYDGVYRDVFPFPQTGASNTTNYAYGPGWTMVPTVVATMVTNDTVAADDVVEHVAPRSLLVKHSYWAFVTAGGNYFFPVERVVGMSNTAPTY